MQIFRTLEQVVYEYNYHWAFKGFVFSDIVL
jgi:hypothetical protein